MGNTCRGSTGETGTKGKEVGEDCPSPRRRGENLMQNLKMGYRSDAEHDIHSVYSVRFSEPPLGVGASGPVYKAIHKDSGQTFALKTLDKAQARSEGSLSALMTELRIMSTLDHPNIAKLFELFETEKFIYLLLELCTGGELLDRLNTKGALAEAVARQRLKEMTDVVRYLHTNDVAHLDLKLENFLYASDSATSKLKLIDFGLSKFIVQGAEKPSGAVGSTLYIAPEMLLNEGVYDQQADCWALGVCSYMLLCGTPPFWDGSFEGTMELVKKGVFSYPAGKQEQLSDLAVGFIEALLVVNPRERLTSKAAQGHPWIKPLSTSFTEIMDASLNGRGSHGADQEKQHQHQQQPSGAANGHTMDGSIHRTTLNPTTTIMNMVSFMKLSRFQRTVCEVLAFMQLSSDELAELREHFVAMDLEGEGDITVNELREALASSSVAEVRALATADSEVQALFDAVDFDKTGKIHWVRRKLACPAERAGRRRPSLLTEATPMHTSLLNEPITKHEFLAATINLAQQDEQQLRKAFDRLDCDGSGEISMGNLKAMLGADMSDAELEEMLEEADIKKNGVIEYEEFGAAMSLARRRAVSQSPAFGALDPASITANCSSVYPPPLALNGQATQPAGAATPTLVAELPSTLPSKAVDSETAAAAAAAAAAAVEERTLAAELPSILPSKTSDSETAKMQTAQEKEEEEEERTGTAAASTTPTMEP